jgi:hypothetical protein
MKDGPIEGGRLSRKNQCRRFNARKGTTRKRAGERERGGGGFRWRRQNVGEVARQNQRRREGDYRLRERERERESCVGGEMKLENALHVSVLCRSRVSVVQKSYLVT